MSRTKREWEGTSRMIAQLQAAGISYEDAWSLRRISMTLQKWFEGECGNSDTHGSWAIVRGYRIAIEGHTCGFQHDDGGFPFIEYHNHRAQPSKPRHTRLPDRERGARTRLAKIMAKYPSLGTYIQGDPRGCALYVLRPGDIREGLEVSSCYYRGIAVHK